MSAPAARARAASASLPRPLLWVGVPLAGLLLVAFFVFLGFPWHRVRDTVALEASAATGANVRIESLGPGVSALGPLLVLRGVRAQWPGGPDLALERASLRPAWSLGWLRGAPAVHVDLAAPEGRARGAVSAHGFDGRVEALALGRLPLASFVPDLALDGTADAEIDLQVGEAGPEGHVALSARDGSLAFPGLPVALPYATLDADVTLSHAQGIELKSLSLDGPMLSLAGEGRVLPGATLAERGLDLRLRVEVREVGVRPMIEGLGVRLDAEGRGELNLRGTLAVPEVR